MIAPNFPFTFEKTKSENILTCSQAYSILTEVQTMLKSETGNHGLFLDASNR